MHVIEAFILAGMLFSSRHAMLYDIYNKCLPFFALIFIVHSYAIATLLLSYALTAIMQTRAAFAVAITVTIASVYTARDHSWSKKYLAL